MSNQYLKLRRSAVPGKVPTVSSIDFGEIALNTYDGLAFMKKSGSNGEEIVTLGGASAVAPFLRNQTNDSTTDTITVHQSIFNPSDLVVLSSSIFIISDTADYYVLGDIYNSGSIFVSGTLKIGGNIHLGPSGSISGPGIIT